MSNKRQGQLTTSGEWAKHLRPFQRRLFWGAERSAERSLIEQELKEYCKNSGQAKQQEDPAPKIMPKNLIP